MAQPTPREQALAYAAGELTPEAAGAFEARLADEPQLAALVSWYRQVSELARQDDAVDPPAAARARALALFNIERPKTDLLAPIRLLASLCFDSRVQLAPVRYADPHGRVQLAFEVEDLQIDLVAQRDATGRWEVNGQLTETSWASSEITVVDQTSGDIIGLTRCDDRAAFRLDLAAGQYEMRLREGQRELVLPTIDLE